MDPIPAVDEAELIAPPDLDIIVVNAMDTALQWIGLRTRQRVIAFV